MKKKHPWLTEDQVKFYESHGIPTEPSYRGATPNQGVLDPCKRYPGEGQAVLKCGNTEIIIGFTALTNLNIKIPPSSSPFFKDVCALSRAVDHIKCEASMGRLAS